ncbi:MAG: UXX-star (seleno)protein family 3 [Candidatus Binatia bacterium]
MAITLYSLAACPHSRALRERLRERGAGFTEIDVGERPECIPELVKLTRRRRIVPVLVDGARVEIAPEGGTEF